MPFLIRFWPYVLGLVLLTASGIAIDRHRHNVDEAAWQAKWQARDLADAKAAAAATAANDAALNAAQKRNEEILSALNDKTAEAAAVARDRDLARRLLAAATRPPAVGGPVPQAGGQPGTAAPGGPGSDSGLGSLFGYVAAALTECRANADRLDALQEQIRPQL
jgi:hypothetical protein